MSDGDWYLRLAYRLTALFLLAIAIVAVLGAWQYGLKQEALYEQEARQAHADYAKYACDNVEQSKKALSSVEKPKGEPCAPSENAQKQNDNRRDYADLVAQRSSALWAKIMGIAALIGMGLSAVGVILVWTTFRETQKANLITNQVHRPWIRIRVAPKMIIFGTAHLYHAEYSFENIGDFPAISLNFQTKVVYDNPDSDDGIWDIWESEDYSPGASSVTVMPRDTYQIETTTPVQPKEIFYWAENKNIVPMLLVTVFYQSSPEQTVWHKTARAFRIRQKIGALTADENAYIEGKRLAAFPMAGSIST